MLLQDANPTPSFGGFGLKGRPLHDDDVIKLGDVELQFVHEVT